MTINNKISKLIKDNQFYTEIYGDTGALIDELPVISKKQVVDGYDKICANTEGTIAISTSGTTGYPLVVRWTERDYTISNFYTWKLRQKWYGVNPSSKFCTFHVDSEYGMQDVVLLNNGRTLSLGKYNYSDLIIDKYIGAMAEFCPEWILGPVSIVYLILERMNKTGANIGSLRYIELNGEYVSDEMYEEIRKLSGAEVGNLYGSTEFNGIAMRCPYGRMHVLENNVYVENEKPGNVSNIIVTGLVNSVMPLIRYDLGDVGLVFDGECPCGCSGKEILIKYGRQTEVICNSKGEKINSSVFSSLLYRLNCENRVAIQYCIDIRDPILVLQILVNPQYINYVKRQIPWMKRELVKFGINYDIEIFPDIKDMLNSEGKFTFIKHKQRKEECYAQKSEYV